MAKAKTITEKEIAKIKKQLNNGENVPNWYGDDDLELTLAQQTKAFDWLRKQYKTPSGKYKANSKLGAREVYICENGKTIFLQGFHNTSFWSKNYQPIYLVVSTSGETMEYYYDGKINIIG